MIEARDIDSKRMLIQIKKPNSIKGRYALFSETVLEILREYCRKYKPNKWLFEDVIEGRRLSVRTVQSILKQAREKAGTEKEISLHCLRHSFTTHLLEAGKVLRYIQEILGHTNSKATEICNLISQKPMGKIKSSIRHFKLEGGGKGWRYLSMKKEDFGSRPEQKYPHCVYVLKLEGNTKELLIQTSWATFLGGSF